MHIRRSGYDIGWIEAAEIPTVDAFLEMLRLKTGWYSGRGPCTAGAIIGNGSPADQEALGEFGERMAVAFQIRDDLLNLTVDTGMPQRPRQARPEAMARSVVGTSPRASAR